MEIAGFLFLVLSLTSAENTTLSATGNSDDVTSLEQLKLEFVQQPGRRSSSDRFWSPWSAWSTCSRTCDGGVSYQLRRCRSNSGCHGDTIRYKICNMQPCPEPVDFRESQCAAFNDIPYHDTYLKWSAHYDTNDPCALTCRGRPDNELDDNTDDEALIVVVLAPKVQDGTRCRHGSLDMCINGKCQRVGCDLRIGSTRRVDECGVCGGDGSSCAQPLYHWVETPASLCSATCGGGYKMSRSICQNRITSEEIDEYLCNVSQKPAPKIVECNTHPCPAKWTTEEWGPCSITCGGGTRLREVYCSEEVNSTKFKVPEHKCTGERPHYEESCGTKECPKWVASEWSGCSVSCGEGVQSRVVSCRDGSRISSTPCIENERPPSVQSCQTGITCPEPKPSIYETSKIDWDSMPEPEGEYRQPLIHPYPPMIPDSGPVAGPFTATAEKLVGGQIEQPGPSEATFIPEKWGPCSVTCGEGIRRRDVECRIYLEFSRAIARLPDEQCHGPKPSTVERCIREPCAMDNRMDIVRDGPVYDQYSYSSAQTEKKIKVAPESSGKTYSWKLQGFTHCSKSCLGGSHESIINCIRDDDQKVVVPLLCPQETRPESLVRTCNDHPCPPRWNFSDFQPCSKSCGIGIQTREVNCIHEITGVSTAVVPNNLCPQPPPPDRQYCNVLDCPVKWHTGNWTKCSKPCGGGLKTRSVTCKQVMAQNHIVDRPVAMCPSMKPPEKKPCNTKPCVETDRPTIAAAVNQTYVQSSVTKKKVTLKIGGSAQVFLGTQVKIKCPVKRYDRSKIQWAKDHKYIQSSKKFRISKKGALKINNVTYRDSGVYACIASRSTADITLTVKPMPGHFPNSEEIHQTQNNIDNPGFYEPNSDPGDSNMGHHRPFQMPGEEDISHEFKPDGISPTKKPHRSRKLKPTQAQPPPFQPDEDLGSINNLDKSWTPLLSTTLISDQEQDQTGEFSGNPSGPSPSGPGGSSSSGSSRPMPHFQQLLANLQNLLPFQAFGNSRGHRALVTDLMPSQRGVAADHPGPFPLGEDDESSTETDEQTGEDGLGPIIVLGKGNPKNLKFEWVITTWTKCSESCGGNGFQMRSAHCMVKLHNTTQYVRDNLCEDAGLTTPSKIQKCGQECPMWTHGDWSTCEDSRCFTWNTAMQKRDVTCSYSNGTEVDATSCDQNEKPTQRQECYNDRCKGTWKVGEWSECKAECEQEGIKYRILQCVWFGTKKPAGNACRDQPRPSVMKICKGPPCSAGGDCKDQSKFCHSVLSKNMCRVYRFQTQCCHTCRGRYLNLG